MREGNSDTRGIEGLGRLVTEEEKIRERSWRPSSDTRGVGESVMKCTSIAHREQETDRQSDEWFMQPGQVNMWKAGSIKTHPVGICPITRRENVSSIFTRYDIRVAKITWLQMRWWIEITNTDWITDSGEIMRENHLRWWDRSGRGREVYLWFSSQCSHGTQCSPERRLTMWSQRPVIAWVAMKQSAMLATHVRWISEMWEERRKIN